MLLENQKKNLALNNTTYLGFFIQNYSRVSINDLHSQSRKIAACFTHAQRQFSGFLKYFGGFVVVDTACDPHVNV